MKRILLGLALSVGMLAIGVTNASASSYCSLDPTLGIGTPLTYSTNLTLSTSSTSTTVYASGTSSTTTFGGGLGLK